MTESELMLPANVRQITVGEKNIYIVGTAHVSSKSVKDVRDTASTVMPDTICVELCEARYKNITQPGTWKKMGIFRIIKEGKVLLLLAQIIMTSFYRRLGRRIGVRPGAEMIKGIEMARKNGAELVLADRDIEITLKRVWRYLNFWDKIQILAQLIISLFAVGRIDKQVIEDMKNQDQLEAMMESVGELLPEIKKRLLDERDVYLAQKIRNAPGTTIVAVVGAAHVSGILQHIYRDMPTEPLMEIPPKSIVIPILKWTIPIIIITLLIVGFLKGGTEHSIESIKIWILVNGIFSAIGAMVALAHPITILAAFAAAPFTNLNPMIAAGLVAGLVQAWVKRPTVADLEYLPEAVTTVRGFWTNPASKILLVVVLANLGSSLGTFVAGSWLISRLF